MNEKARVAVIYIYIYICDLFNDAVFCSNYE